MTPAKHRFAEMANGTNGVATISPYNQTGMLACRKTAAVNWANLKTKPYKCYFFTIKIAKEKLPFAIVATIETEHNAPGTVRSARETLANILAQSLGRLNNDQIVHGAKTSLHNTTQSGRAEL